MIRTLLYILSLWVASVVAFATADFATKRWVLDHTHWFEYSKVEFIAPLVEGRPVDMLSYSDWHRVSDVTWNDALFCYLDLNDEMATRIVTPPSIVDRAYLPNNAAAPKPWRFLEAAPRAGLECYSKHVIVVNVGYGITKTQTLYSDPITITARD